MTSDNCLNILVSGYTNEKTRAVLAKDLVAYKTFASKRGLSFVVSYDSTNAGELAKSLAKPLGIECKEVLGSPIGEDLNQEYSFVLFYERAERSQDSPELSSILAGLEIPILYRDTKQPDSYDRELIEDRMGTTSYAKYHQAVDISDTSIKLPNMGVKIFQQIDLRPSGWGAFVGDDSGRTFRG